MIEIPKYPQEKKKDPVARSMADPNAVSKPATMGKVRIRPTLGDKSINRKQRRKKRRRGDPRDVMFY